MVATVILGMLCVHLLCFSTMFLLISKRLDGNRMGMGAMQGVTYIQRVATQGGVAPAAACTAANAGQKQVVKYQADYIIWKAAS